MYACVVVLFAKFSDVYKMNKMVESFQQFLDNLFAPLFEVSIDPSSHPELHAFLQHVSLLVKQLHLALLLCYFHVREVHVAVTSLSKYLLLPSLLLVLVSPHQGK
jgi:hypothetical protein